MPARNVSFRIVEQPSGGWLVYECKTLDFHALQIPDPAVENLIGKITNWKPDEFKVFCWVRDAEYTSFEPCTHPDIIDFAAALRWAVTNLPRR